MLTLYEKAISTENWVRFEGVFRNEYAHQISNALMNVNNDEEYLNLIACTILRIMLEDVNKAWKMKDLAKAAGCSIGQVAKVKEFLLK